MGRSSVACAAADFVFFASGIHKFVERWDNVKIYSYLF